MAWQRRRRVGFFGARDVTAESGRAAPACSASTDMTANGTALSFALLFRRRRLERLGSLAPTLSCLVSGWRRYVQLSRRAQQPHSKHGRRQLLLVQPACSMGAVCPEHNIHARAIYWRYRGELARIAWRHGHDVRRQCNVRSQHWQSPQIAANRRRLTT